jgi:hypothetical protein
MSLTLKRGDKVFEGPKTLLHHREDDFSVHFGDGELIVKASGGATFLHVKGITGACECDVLNFPHVDVSKRKAELEKKKQAKEKGK